DHIFKRDTSRPSTAVIHQTRAYFTRPVIMSSQPINAPASFFEQLSDQCRRVIKRFGVVPALANLDADRLAIAVTITIPSVPGYLIERYALDRFALVNNNVIRSRAIVAGVCQPSALVTCRAGRRSE